MRPTAYLSTCSVALGVFASCAGGGAHVAQSDGPPLDASPAARTSERVLGVFRNTYYDLPHEADYSGATVSLMSAGCSPIASVPRPFFEHACVQGSGALRSGRIASFARRDCGCAEVCARTGQRICFELLDSRSFPFGRGAAGRAIRPLVTVAADTRVLPFGTAIYVPEFDGVPLGEASTEKHDGCFVVEDRGAWIVGAHIDVFTGSEKETAFLDRVLPSNRGVTVVVDARRCDHLRTAGP